MSAKAFDDAWAQVQGDDAADPAMASLVRTALAKRIIETRGMASVVSPPFRRPNCACQVGAAGALVGEPRGPRLQVALTPLFHDIDGMPFEAFLSPDGLHMNDWSYNCFAKALADAIADAATPQESSNANANATTGEKR